MLLLQKPCRFTRKSINVKTQIGMNIKHLLCAAAVCFGTLAYGAQPKYVFMMIGDGMGPGPIMATQNYLRLGSETPDARLNMLQMPVSSRAMSYSASSPVTDSAAAGTALSTGSKTKNGMLGMNADTVAVYSIARDLKQQGWGIGIVTNNAPDDATPGAFYAHVPSRSMYYEIGKDAAASGVDFLAGASLRGRKDKEGNPTDLYNILEQSGVTILRGKKGAEQVRTTDSRRIVLVNPEGHAWDNEMGFAIDGADADTVGLSLYTATEACLYHLEKNSPDHFLMVIEDGMIDHLLHGNDGSSSIRQILSFDRVIGRVLEFYRQHPDETLVIVTADHDTGGMSNGCRTTRYKIFFDNVNHQKLSKDAFSDYCTDLLKSGRKVTWEEMEKVLAEKLGMGTVVNVSDEQEEYLKKAFDKTFVKRNAEDVKGLYKDSNAFASAVFKVFNNSSGFGFTTSNHTGNFTPVFAIGVGSERFTGTLDNTEIPQILRELTK